MSTDLDHGTPLRIGFGNTVPAATLVADPAPATSLEALKTERRADRVVWPDVTRDIVIDIRLNALAAAGFLALPHASLTGDDAVRVELFGDDAFTDRVYVTSGGDPDDEFVRLGEPPPIGVWIAGIDPYAVALAEDVPTTWVAWLDRSVVYRAARLTIRPALTAGRRDLSLRMLMLGRLRELERNFVYGSTLSYLDEPRLAMTAGGSHVPVGLQRATRTFSMSMPMMTDGDRRSIARLEQSLALTGEPMLLSAHPGREGWERSDYTMLGRFAERLVYRHTFEGLHAADATVVEV